MRKLLPVLLLVFGCNGDDGSGLPQKGDTVDKLEFCLLLSTPVCERIVECAQNNNETQVACENSFMNSCCRDNATCDQTDQISADMEPCMDAYSTIACSEIQTGNLPTECLGL